MRRIFALLTTLSMLHLSLVGGDLVCASHEGAGSAMPGMRMAGAARHADGASSMPMDGPAADRHGSAQPAKDCATPSQARCCEAMTSCSVSTTIGAVERPVTGELPAAATPTLPSVVLESVLTAPEPPPPKA